MRYAHLLLISAFFLLTSGVLSAQERDNTVPRVSPNASSSYTAGITEISVSYGITNMRDREIFGELVPYGEIWRMGANEATVVSFSTDVEVAEQPVSAGHYALFAIPGEEEWTIILNAEPNQWGTYQYDESLDVIRFPVFVEPIVEIEGLTFMFTEPFSEDGWDGTYLVMLWAGVGISIPIEAHTDQLIAAHATEAAEAEDWGPLTEYARHTLSTDGRMIEEGLGWGQAAAVGNPSFGSLSTLAWLYAANGNMTEAISFGEQAIAMADDAQSRPFGYDQLAADIESWKGE